MNSLLKSFSLLSAIIFLAIFPRPASAQVVWNGGNTGVWNVPGNWTGGVAPGSGTNAVIDSGTANFTTLVTGTAQNLTVGNSSTGGLWIDGTAADLVVSQLSMGQGGGSKGFVTVTSGTLDDSAGSLTMATSGSAVLTVNGGTLDAASLTMGHSASVVVSSGTFNVSGDAHIGPGGTFGVGSMLVQGGYFSDANAFIGGSAGSTAAKITGGTWASSGTISVGITTGSASMTVAGGNVTSAGAVIGNSTHGIASISSGTWSNSGTFIIGGSSFGSLDIGSAGELDVGSGTGTIVLGSAVGSTGILNFGPGGTLNAGLITAGSGHGTVDLDLTSASDFNAQIAGNVTVLINGLAPGASTTFSGTSTYSGTTNVTSAALTVNGSIKNSPTVVNTGTLAGSGVTGNVTVNKGSLLEGSLTSGTVQVNAGGTVEAGDAPGENVMTTLTLSGSATYYEEIDAPGSGSFTGPGNHPIAGTDYGQTTLTGPGNGQVAVSLDSTNSILQLNVVGTLPAGGVGSNAKPYKAGTANSSLDNYFVLHLSDSTDTVSGRFAQVTLDGTNFVTIDYSSGNLVGGAAGDGTFTLNGQEWVISYSGNETTNSTIGGDDVVITAIPEPGSYILLALGGVGLAMFARRRNSPQGASK